MKTISLLISVLIVLFLLVTGCKKDEGSLTVEGYIVGSFISDELNKETGQTTGNKTPRGYCIILTNSKNADNLWPMDFYTFNLPQGLINFPENILTPEYNGNNCGPTFFPENFKKAYKIRFEYQNLPHESEMKFDNGCFTFYQPFPWEDFPQVTIKNVKQQ